MLLRTSQIDTPASPAVRAFVDGDRERWDAYVAAHPRATFFHQIGWKRVLEATFGYRSYYVLAERDGAVCGLLPLFACRSLRGKMGLYSLPHTVYGGPVGDDAECEAALLAAARALAGSLGARAIELRNRYPSLLDLPVIEEAVTFEKELPGTVAEVRRTFPKKAREMINQATKRHRLEADFASDLATFYDLLAASYLTLGTPVFPKRFFGRILAEFGPNALNLVVRHEGAPIAAVLSVVFRETMMPLFSGEAPGVKHLKGGNYKYFRLMEEAVARGLRRFDFGRTRLNNTGSLRFKTNQGFVAEPLPYQVDGAVSFSNPNTGVYLGLRKAWRALPPRVARIAGPAIVRFFP